MRPVLYGNQPNVWMVTTVRRRENIGRYSRIFLGILSLVSEKHMLEYSQLLKGKAGRKAKTQCCSYNDTGVSDCDPPLCQYPALSHQGLPSCDVRLEVGLAQEERTAAAACCHL